jgi:hypothetical protein
MAYPISAADFEKYYLSDNCIGIVDVHEQHLLRVAERLSERHPGVIFLWHTPTRTGTYTVCAIKPSQRPFSDPDETRLVAAGQAVARNIAAKYPVKRRGFWARLFHQPTKPGWQYTDKI